MMQSQVKKRLKRAGRFLKTMKNKVTFCCVATMLGAAGAACAAVDEPDRPNILFILTDDQGYGDLGRHGHPLLKTPNLDRLYDESVSFERFYVSPACSPTRAALMTGMHEFRNGVTHTIAPREHLNKDAIILPQLLKTAGYTTGIIGKWHLGDGPGYSPQFRGFDWVSSNVGGSQSHVDTVMVRNGKRSQAQGFREDRFIDEAIAFIEENSTRPFFCYLATFSPHTPLAAPEKFIAPYRGKVSEKEATFLGMIANIDWNVGRLFKRLDELKLTEKTIVVFMNDNGETVGLDMYNAGMRGAKTSAFEGGTRAMSLWRWPGHWAPHTVDALTAHLDVLPTLCELAGVSISAEMQSKLDGFSFFPLLKSSDGSFPRDRILFHHSGRWATGTALDHKYALGSVQQGSWYLTHAHACTNPACYNVRATECYIYHRVESAGVKQAVYTKENARYHWGSTAPDHWALFNLKDDPGCKKDVSKNYQGVVGSLSHAYDRWWDSLFPGILLNEPGAVQCEGEYRGGKASRDEGASRVPVLVRWPEMIGAGKTSDALMAQMDFAASFVAMLDVEIPEGQCRDNENHLTALMGNHPDGRSVFVEQGVGVQAVIHNGGKYCAPGLITDRITTPYEGGGRVSSTICGMTCRENTTSPASSLKSLSRLKPLSNR